MTFFPTSFKISSWFGQLPTMCLAKAARICWGADFKLLISSRQRCGFGSIGCSRPAPWAPPPQGLWCLPGLQASHHDLHSQDISCTGWASSLLLTVALLCVLQNGKDRKVVFRETFLPHLVLLKSNHPSQTIHSFPFSSYFTLNREKLDLLL